MPQSRGRGQIISKGKDKWLVRIFRGRSASGKKEYFNKIVEGSKTRAQKYLTAKCREQDLGFFVESSRQLLNDHLDGWLNLVRPRVARQTHESYELLLRCHIRPAIGEMRIADVRQDHVQKIYDEMLAAGLSSRTVRYVHSVASMAFKKAIELNKIIRNPCEFVVLPKMRKKEVKVLSPDQTRRFLDCSHQDMHGLIFELAIMSGMRPEEYLALRWSDVDLTGRIATVRQALIWNRKGGGFRFDAPKTPQSRRSIPLPEDLISALRSHRTSQLEQRLKLGQEYTNLDLVFASELGGPLNSRNLAQRNFVRILKAAGLSKEGIVLYSLRHTCATLLLIAGENPKVVSERLGHTSVKMTLDTYSHVLPDMQRGASARLAGMLYG
jgi:integrase